MKILILYIVTLIFFLGADAFGLRYIVKPVFDRYVMHLYADPFRVVPALLFYLGYVAGMLWFVSVPALRDGDPLAALWGGALLGMFAYGTYEFTNFATLRDWSMQQVVVDTIWGGLLTGVSAWFGVLIARMTA
ncbi:DUF2177 family protein [Sulfitobacter sp. F26204]|uniref:DUF2177 family protein n=1 Tax=Sulfitobacter sp. F26204 TaxID=2996014 RepID=UPI00225E0025|nr:DUF2177 family protein [Sulfitobacter sp. F26204]MCX7561143.1 DUF2177 family protein [Sulfitobacter sp. F26204]